MIASIVIKLQGGLGNQLFQYAVGRSIELTTGGVVQFDRSWYARQDKRKYELDLFNTVISFAPQEDVERLSRYRTVPGILGTLRNIFRANPSIYRHERGFTFDPTTLAVHGPVYLDGYWQSWRYFEQHADVIRRELTLKGINIDDDPIAREIASATTVSLHIRRSDYVSTAASIYYNCPVSYYEHAIATIEGTCPSFTLVVFSDDIPWAKENLKTTHPVTFVEGRKNYEDLALMSRCNHNIIANSTFSWWGAWLNPNPTKVVIAPHRWFTNSAMSDADLIPPSWRRIA